MVTRLSEGDLLGLLQDGLVEVLADPIDLWVTCPSSYGGRYHWARSKVGSVDKHRSVYFRGARTKGKLMSVRVSFSFSSCMPVAVARVRFTQVADSAARPRHGRAVRKEHLALYNQGQL